MNNTNSFNISAQKNSNVYYCGHYFNANIGNSLAGYMNSKPNSNNKIRAGSIHVINPQEVSKQLLIM